jgi:hypothetical protein|uniref:Uncharacterized protein n=1 Tax=Zea mays TaxID=4577 RepID=A0A804LS38_MAIZE
MSRKMRVSSILVCSNINYITSPCHLSRLLSLATSYIAPPLPGLLPLLDHLRHLHRHALEEPLAALLQPHQIGDLRDATRGLPSNRASTWCSSSSDVSHTSESAVERRSTGWPSVVASEGVRWRGAEIRARGGRKAGGRCPAATV